MKALISVSNALINFQNAMVCTATMVLLKCFGRTDLNWWEATFLIWVPIVAIFTIGFFIILVMQIIHLRNWILKDRSVVEEDPSFS